MPLDPGVRLGTYEISGPLGAGGMGEVYKARDTRLDRSVAIKVLAEHVASDPDLKQRFEREARTIAALNHPHICTLYDIGSQDGVDFLVMEYLEGQTLADHLEKGALPLAEALKMAIQVSDGLAKAHRLGIVHRDLKPGNIMLTKQGAKLLDFGLAKLRKPETTGPTGFSMTMTQSAPLTGQGAILGTLQYMAPEQIEGKDADAEADIFAFGAVVYEMLTGQKAFSGESQASLIGAIMERDPVPMSSLAPMSPEVLDRVVKKCLAKDPDARWQSADDLHDELVWIAQGGGQAPAAEQVSAGGWRQPLPWAAAGLVLAAATGSGGWYLDRPAESLTTRFTLDTQGSGFPVAVSPDGRTVAFGDEGTFYLRQLDQLEPVPLERVESPHGMGGFSPDGEWLLVIDEDSLKRIPLNGGPVVTVEDVGSGPMRDWGAGDAIVRGGQQGLWVVPSSGGTASQLTVAEDELRHANPTFIPGGRAVVFERHPFDGDPQVAIAELDTGEYRSLLPGSTPRVTTSGHLVFWREGALWAAPFDVDRLEVNGDAEPVVEGVAWLAGTAHYDVSTNGTLVNRVGGTGLTTMTWINRVGRREPVGLPPPRISRPTRFG